jgi:predicted nucleic acid-binding protein
MKSQLALSCLLRPSTLGTEKRLRSGDALYIAAAERTGVRLVTWDPELIERAGSITPIDWLAEQSEGED